MRSYLITLAFTAYSSSHSIHGAGRLKVDSRSVIFGAIPNPIQSTSIGAIAMVGMVWVIMMRSLK